MEVAVMSVVLTVSKQIALRQNHNHITSKENLVSQVT